MLVETFRYPPRGEAPAFTAVMRYPETAERDAARLRRRIRLTRRQDASAPAGWPDQISVDIFSPESSWVPHLRTSSRH